MVLTQSSKLRRRDGVVHTSVWDSKLTFTGVMILIRKGKRKTTVKNVLKRRHCPGVGNDNESGVYESNTTKKTKSKDSEVTVC